MECCTILWNNRIIIMWLHGIKFEENHVDLYKITYMYRKGDFMSHPLEFYTYYVVWVRNIILCICNACVYCVCLCV